MPGASSANCGPEVSSPIGRRFTATVGDGCPDLLVGASGINVLLEVKDGSLSPSRRKLTDAEARFFDTWPGQVALVNDTNEAIAAVRDAIRGASRPSSDWLTFDSTAPDDDIGWGPVDQKPVPGFDPDVY